MRNNMRNFLLIGMMILAGCNNDTPPDSFGGGSSVSTSNGGSGGMNGSNSSGNNVGGSCEPTVTCQSIGAECGTIQNNGCGESMDCGNNCTAPMSCGGGNEQFKCGCTPRSCEVQGKNCGTINDGCGHQIFCGNEECSEHHTCIDNVCTCIPRTTCGEDYDHECGGFNDDYCGGTLSCENCNPQFGEGPCGAERYDVNGNLLPISANMCGGGCLAMTASESLFDCSSRYPAKTHYWWCTPYNSMDPLGIHPPGGCSSSLSMEATYHGVSGQGWCCERGN